ncbi:MAG TPA: NYN domain-containing protein [archaeon]|nr:NYN domain-containing protein [archaeon]
MLLENLFERHRLLELANRCTTRDPDIDLRQARIYELVEILTKAWEIGPQRGSGSLWGAVDQELAGRLKSYLGLGEQRLHEMLSTLQSEGAYDRKTAAVLLWVLLHEKHDNLLAEFDLTLSQRYRDMGSQLGTKLLCMTKVTELEERIASLGRELKGLFTEQKLVIESLVKRLENIEESDKQGSAGLLSGGSEALKRRLQNIPEDKMRVGVFVDVQNMFYAAKKLDGARIDYESMLERIVGPRRLIKAVAYIVESSEIDQSGFISVLEKKGYQVRRKELKSFLDGTAKGDWDMGMAIDIIELASYLDVVALVTGDGDFVSLVRLVKKIGPKVELYAFGHNLSSELREVSDQFLEIRSDLLLKNQYHQAPPAVAEDKKTPTEEEKGVIDTQSASGASSEKS